MAAAPSHQIGSTIRGEPLYFFYDCEATGLDATKERIIEIGAVLCTRNLSPRTAEVLKGEIEFTSLCYCTHPINPESAKVLPLTLQDLKHAPMLEDVLKRFCHWIKDRVSEAEKNEKKAYTPVFVAHSGNLLDYPLLFNEIKRTGSYELQRTFEQLNLQFADSYTAVRQLARSSYIFNSFPGLGVKDLHRGLLYKPYEGHRALPDAKALHNIFTQCESTKQVQLFRELQKIIQCQQSIMFLREEIPKFKEACINPAKAEQLLMKGITYDKILKQYKESPATFQWYLRNMCGITKPKRELLDHFKYTF